MTVPAVTLWDPARRRSRRNDFYAHLCQAGLTSRDRSGASLAPLTRVSVHPKLFKGKAVEGTEGPSS